jgi:hypothetical protein
LLSVCVQALVDLCFLMASFPPLPHDDNTPTQSCTVRTPQTYIVCGQSTCIPFLDGFSAQLHCNVSEKDELAIDLYRTPDCSGSTFAAIRTNNDTCRRTTPVLNIFSARSYCCTYVCNVTASFVCITFRKTVVMAGIVKHKHYPLDQCLLVFDLCDLAFNSMWSKSWIFFLTC